MTVTQKIITGIFSAVAGAGLVVAGLKYSILNWIVDVPGWIVSRFTSVDFHEGEGALGLVLAIFLSWLFASLAVFGGTFLIVKTLRRSDSSRN